MMTSGFIKKLHHPSCYPHPVQSVRVVETHISWILLTGDFAYKIKKPVCFSFLDFSTLEKRRWFCEEEVRLNRRLAPILYLGVIPITGSPADPRMGGDGEPFEYAVKMRQFDPSQEFPLLLKRGELDGDLLGGLAERIAEFHEAVPVAGSETSYGNPDVIWKPVEECFTEISPNNLPSSVMEGYGRLRTWCHQEWRSRQADFLKRKEGGRIRECHGDLHLSNIALHQGVPCIFDALEFEPRLRWIDVMSEVAFLVMDLERHGRIDLAYGMLNRYLEMTGDYEGMTVFRFYEIYRALVRAKVAGIRLNQLSHTQPEWTECFEDWTKYLSLAIRFSEKRALGIMLMHGVSGTGKTTVSSKILQSLGAIRVRSDVERRRIVQARRSGEAFSDAYSPVRTQETYERLARVADGSVSAGFPVIVDATFLRRADRMVFLQLAQTRQVPLIILDVSAPESVRSQRIEQRRREGHDASEATVSVMQSQVEQAEPFSQAELDKVVSIDSTNEDSIQSAIRHLSQRLSRGV